MTALNDFQDVVWMICLFGHDLGDICLRLSLSFARINEGIGPTHPLVLVPLAEARQNLLSSPSAAARHPVLKDDAA